MLKGRVVDEDTKQKVAYALVYMPELEKGSITNEQGEFVIPDLPGGHLKIEFSLLGYAKRVVELNVDKNYTKLVVQMKRYDLSLKEVVVTARQEDEPTTSYKISSAALEHEQIVDITDIQSLLPGGKTPNETNLATSDQRFSLHSEASGEMGNPSFGTAIDVDGVRLQNNSNFDETKSVDTRNISTVNIESVEVVTGIPSVEYGDLSNGIVKINTKKGITPFTSTVTLNPNTKQIGINKGFDLGHNRGILNASLERTNSVSNLVSPYTSYERNALSLNYYRPIHDRFILTTGFYGNLGGYNSEADPDQFSESYVKKKDNVLRANVKGQWFFQKSWISNLSIFSSVNYNNKFSETNENESSASTQAAVHTTDDGYYIATDYDEYSTAPVTLLPTGYWYQLSYNDNKMIDYTLKLKADWVKKVSSGTNKLMFGIDYANSGNLGKGTYYDDMRYAPTWRPYTLSELPHTNNLSFYLENTYTHNFSNSDRLSVIAGLRSDNMYIRNSAYGLVGNISPRFNVAYHRNNGKSAFVRHLNLYGGWGKSTKLPSFQVLYPKPSYSDQLAFTPGSTADNTAYYAYYTQESAPLYNPDLKWQSANQIEFGVGLDMKFAQVKVSGFYTRTQNPYISQNVYQPYTYKLTTQSAIENSPIPIENRRYTVDSATGIVTIHDAGGIYSSYELDYTERNMYLNRKQYINGSTTTRAGLDWIIDFKQIRAAKTSFRIDGSFYHYKGLDETMLAWKPSSAMSMTDGSPYSLVGYYAGSSSTSISSSSATVANGKLSNQLNTNFTLITHIPKVRMIVTLRVEASLLNFSRNLSEYADGSSRGFIIEDGSTGYEGWDTDIYNKNKYVAVYPEYYATWDKPDEKIPFKQAYQEAKENNPSLYTDLSKLVVKSNLSYYFDERRISAYFSTNLNITKEIGDVASISFFARNFYNNMGSIYISNTNQNSSLFDSSYIPKFYYGLTMRLKL